MNGSRNKNLLIATYQDQRSVFRLKDVALLTGDTDRLALSKKLHYYVKTGKLQNPRKGIYTKPDYSPEELACRLYTPSYISLEYVLQRSGVVFQFDSAITSISYLSRRTEVEGQVYAYRKIKNTALTDLRGIVRNQNGINMATPERAFLDLLYLNPGFYFDNLKVLDAQKVSALLDIYQCKALKTNTNKRFKDSGNQ